MKLNKELRDEYLELWKTMVVKDGEPVIDRIAKKIIEHKKHYFDLELATGVPWFMCGFIHNLEGGLNFDRQLHNGQPWWKKTTIVPKGIGPWSSWFEASKEAMEDLNYKMKKLLGADFKWDIATISFSLEDHNGWGYRLYHATIKSPYLYSFSNHYTKGKYIEKKNIWGQWKVKWKANLVSQQIGAMVLMKKVLELDKDSITPTPEKPEPVKPFQSPVAKPRKKSFWEKVFGWLF